jgi:RimJ/RimL family protein N-acetyltransferase
VGYLILFGIGDEDRSLLLKRIVIAEKGKGLGRDTMRLLKKIAFEQLGAHRLWLDVVVHNTRAQRLYETEGFIVEGTLREAAEIQGRFESLLVMSILESDYEPSEPAGEQRTTQNS